MIEDPTFNICIHETIRTATVTVKAPSKALALRAVETTLENAFDELTFKKGQEYIFTCSKNEASA